MHDMYIVRIPIQQIQHDVHILKTPENQGFRGFSHMILFFNNLFAFSL